MYGCYFFNEYIMIEKKKASAINMEMKESLWQMTSPDVTLCRTLSLFYIKQPVQRRLFDLQQSGEFCPVRRTRHQYSV